MSPARAAIDEHTPAEIRRVAGPRGVSSFLGPAPAAVHVRKV